MRGLYSEKTTWERDSIVRKLYNYRIKWERDYIMRKLHERGYMERDKKIT